MNLLIKLISFLLLIGIYAPSYAAVNDVEFISCVMYNEAEDDKKTEDGKGDEETEEEEPDCE